MSHDYATGDRIGTNYVVVRPIGAGGHGSTLLVRHHVLTNKRFALKVLHASLTNRSDLVERMKREAQVLASMNHPNIVTVLDAGMTEETPARPFLVMEYLTGKSVREVLSVAPNGIGLNNALGIATDMADALDHAHSRYGVIHRDLKPDNVFLNFTAKDVTVTKLLDFGIAHVLSAIAGHARYRTDRATAIGTPRYMAPEQLRGVAPTPQTDLYALGLVLYEMLVGRGPFDKARTIAALGEAHLHQHPPAFVRHSVPAELERLVMALLAKDPDQRPKGAARVASELRQISHRAEIEYGRVVEQLEKTDESPLESIMATTAAHHHQTSSTGARGDAITSPDAPKVREMLNAARGPNATEPDPVRRAPLDATEPRMELPPIDGRTVESLPATFTPVMNGAPPSATPSIDRSALTRSLPQPQATVRIGPREGTEEIPATVPDKMFVDVENVHAQRDPLPACGRRPDREQGTTSASVAVASVAPIARRRIPSITAVRATVAAAVATGFLAIGIAGLALQRRSTASRSSTLPSASAPAVETVAAPVPTVGDSASAAPLAGEAPSSPVRPAPSAPQAQASSAPASAVQQASDLDLSLLQRTPTQPVAAPSASAPPIKTAPFAPPISSRPSPVLDIKQDFRPGPGF